MYVSFDFFWAQGIGVTILVIDHTPQNLIDDLVT